MAEKKWAMGVGSCRIVSSSPELMEINERVMSVFVIQDDQSLKLFLDKFTISLTFTTPTCE